jgi:hypothetical protein
MFVPLLLLQHELTRPAAVPAPPPAKEASSSNPFSRMFQSMFGSTGGASSGSTAAGTNPAASAGGAASGGGRFSIPGAPGSSDLTGELLIVPAPNCVTKEVDGVCQQLQVARPSCIAAAETQLLWRACTASQLVGISLLPIWLP